jgi:hypothetical protein
MTSIVTLLLFVLVGVHTRFVQKLSLTYYTHNLPLCLPLISASSRASALW